jgi:hypothetical protein
MKSLGLHQKENCTEYYLRGQAKDYATLAEAGSVGTGVLDEGAEVEGAEAEGVGAGRIRDTSLGTYSFTFVKNPSSPLEDEHNRSQPSPSLPPRHVIG